MVSVRTENQQNPQSEQKRHIRAHACSQELRCAAQNRTWVGNGLATTCQITLFAAKTHGGGRGGEGVNQALLELNKALFGLSPLPSLPPSILTDCMGVIVIVPTETCNEFMGFMAPLPCWVYSRVYSRVYIHNTTTQYE